MLARLVRVATILVCLGIANDSLAQGGKRLIAFKNELQSDIFFSLRTPQNPAGTAPRLIGRGRTISYVLRSEGPFDLFGTTLDDGRQFERIGVDLQTLFDGKRDGAVPIRGVFDCELEFDDRGGIVHAERVALLYSFGLRRDSRPFTVLAFPNGQSVEHWRCSSMREPARPSIYTDIDDIDIFIQPLPGILQAPFDFEPAPAPYFDTPDSAPAPE